MPIVTLIITNEGSENHRLTGRVAEIATWLAEQAKAIGESQKGQIQIDYANDSLVMRNTQVTEHRTKK
jgi:hypothetical protein